VCAAYENEGLKTKMMEEVPKGGGVGKIRLRFVTAVFLIVCACSKCSLLHEIGLRSKLMAWAMEEEEGDDAV
jgi:hypothetical protein